MSIYNNTSVSKIQDNFKPTWLYVKQHNQTGLKYFGMTTQDPLTYKGSGLYWKRHIKKYGNNVNTLWCQKFNNKSELREYAIKFSNDNMIVESKDWANLKPEFGTDGGSAKGRIVKETSRQKNIIASTGRIVKPTTRQKISDKLSGRDRSYMVTDEWKHNISVALKGKSNSLKGSKQIQVSCIYCKKSGGSTLMKRYHLDNCKFKF
jgi:hypothetical protein